MSKNVFRDLGFDDADEMLVTADLGLELRMAILGKFFDLDRLPAHLGITKNETLALKNGDYFCFSSKRLRELLAKVRAED